MATLNDIIRPNYIRLTYPDGSFFCELDPERGIAKGVRRSGTAFFDIPEIIAEWHRTHGVGMGEATEQNGAQDGGRLEAQGR